jgi:hypothetical protein
MLTSVGRFLAFLSVGMGLGIGLFILGESVAIAAPFDRPYGVRVRWAWEGFCWSGAGQFQHKYPGHVHLVRS